MNEDDQDDLLSPPRPMKVRDQPPLGVAKTMVGRAIAEVRQHLMRVQDDEDRETCGRALAFLARGLAEMEEL